MRWLAEELCRSAGKLCHSGGGSAAATGGVEALSAARRGTLPRRATDGIGRKPASRLRKASACSTAVRARLKPARSNKERASFSGMRSSAQLWLRKNSTKSASGVRTRFFVPSTSVVAMVHQQQSRECPTMPSWRVNCHPPTQLN